MADYCFSLETNSRCESLHAVEAEAAFYAGNGDGSSSVLGRLMISLMPHIMSNATIIVNAPTPK